MNHRTLQPLEPVKLDNNGQFTIQRSATPQDLRNDSGNATESLPKSLDLNQSQVTADCPEPITSRSQKSPHLVKGSSRPGFVLYQWNTFLIIAESQLHSK